MINENVVFFNTTEEMLDFEQRNEAEANAATLDWQRQLAPGQYFISTFEGLTIYNKILEDVLEPGDAPLAEGYVMVQAFSEWEPEGEVGEAHVVLAERQLTSAQFERARLLEWPNYPGGLMRVLQG